MPLVCGPVILRTRDDERDGDGSVLVLGRPPGSLWLGAEFNMRRGWRAGRKG